MPVIKFEDLEKQFFIILVKHKFDDVKAARCAKIFAQNTLDGVFSHGANRFPVFIDYVKRGLVNPQAEPKILEQRQGFSHWDGQLGAGMYNASLAMDEAVKLAKQYQIGVVTLKNTNHWMRGGTYGWQAANAGCIGICFTNTIANLPPWGGREARLGNNPVVIAVPRKAGHLVLDMAMSQFSFGKLQEYQLKNEQLPIAGGFDEQGNLSADPAEISKSGRALPIGFWKGSGLALMLDVLLTALSGGKSTKAITEAGDESGVTQLFIAINKPDLHEDLIDQIITYTKSAATAAPDAKIYYPGERTIINRENNLQNGIPVDDRIWAQICAL